MKNECGKGKQRDKMEGAMRFRWSTANFGILHVGYVCVKVIIPGFVDGLSVDPDCG